MSDYSALAAWLERKVRWLRRRADSYVTLDPVDSDDYDKLDACAAALREYAAERDAARALVRDLAAALEGMQPECQYADRCDDVPSDEDRCDGCVANDALARAREMIWLRSQRGCCGMEMIR